MADKALDTVKDQLINAITDAYSRGAMEMAAFERAVTRITASQDVDALAGEASALGLALARPAWESGASTLPQGLESDLVELSCVSGKIRLEGEWVKAERYRLFLKSSSARLDLREYEGRRGFRLFIDLEAISSTIRIEVPEGFEIQDRLSERTSSTLRNRPKSSVYDDCAIILSGSIRSSTLRVKYR